MGTKTMLTPEDLLALPEADGARYELREGELVKVGTAHMRHERIKRRILKRFFAYEEQHPRAGEVYAESLFKLSSDTARMPDAAFVGAAKAALLSDGEGLIPVVPDIAVEVISESENAADAETKVREYLAAGVSEVWQFYARERFVRVRTSSGSRDLSGDDRLETPMMPGFSAPVSSFFA